MHFIWQSYAHIKLPQVQKMTDFHYMKNVELKEIATYTKRWHTKARDSDTHLTQSLRELYHKNNKKRLLDTKYFRWNPQSSDCDDLKLRLFSRSSVPLLSTSAQKRRVRDDRMWLLNKYVGSRNVHLAPVRYLLDDVAQPLREKQQKRFAKPALSICDIRGAIRKVIRVLSKMLTFCSLENGNSI